MNALLHPEATEDSLRKAIDKSWKYYQNQYQNYPLDPSINYPNEAWARSQGSGTLTIELPPGETLITNPVYLPANISLRGSGVWAGSTLRMKGNGQLVLLGDMETDLGLVKPFGGGIKGVRFVGNDRSLISLWGSFQDLRLRSLHFISKGTKEPDIHHFRFDAANVPSEFGTVNTTEPHLKELKIENCQFESGNTSMLLIAPMRSTVVNCQFLYGELGIAAHEAAEFYVANNQFNGGLKCPAIIEGSSQKGYITFTNNAMDGCTLGAQLYVHKASSLRDISPANNFWNGGGKKKSVKYFERGTKVVKGAGVFKTGQDL